MAPRDVLTHTELERLGLGSDPFETRGAAAFFDGGGRGRQLEQLTHFAEWARSVIVVSGEADAGKSTLCAALATALPEGTRVALLTGGILTSPGELLARIAHGLGMSLPAALDNDALAAGILEYAAAAQARDGCASLVLLDDAHELGRDCVRALADLAVRALEPHALNIVLFAEPGFAGALRKAAADLEPELVWQEIPLAPFSLDDTRAYLQTRLERAGLRGRLPLSDAAIREVHRRSHGLPGRIDPLAVAALRRAAHRALAGPRARAVTLGIAGALVLGAALAMWRFDGGFEHPGSDGDAAAAATNPVSEVAAGLEDGALLSAAPDLGETDFPEHGPEPAPKPAHEKETLPTRQVAAGVAAAETPARASGNETPPTSAVEAAALAPDAEPGADGIAWLRKQPPSNYTVQVLGLSSAAALERFMARQDRDEPFVARATVRAGKPWFVVYYGSFETRAAAVAAAEALPSTVGKVEPWVRRLGDVQAELR